jgi:hypothetical protein
MIAKDVHPCVCAWIDALGAPAKNAITQLINTIANSCKAVLTYLKLVSTFVNNINKELEIYAKKAELEAEKAVINGISIPFDSLTKLIKPYTDCDYLNSVMTGINKIKDDLGINRLKKHIRDVEDAIDRLEEEKKKWDKLDRYIQAMEDLKNIADFCG